MFRNQLEPLSLVEAFTANPPKAFEIVSTASSRCPAFVAPFDLLTTANDGLRRFVRSLPFYARWSSLLTPRVAFVGTTVSEYALLDRDDRVGELAQYWKAAWGTRYPILVVKDLPQGSPLLGEDDNRAAVELAEACEEDGYVLLAGQALAYVAINFSDISGYLDRLSASRRRDIRRKLRSVSAIETRRLQTGDSQFFDERTIDEYVSLYNAVYNQSDTKFDLLTREFFATVLRNGSSDGIVFEYRQRKKPEKLVGWNLCYVAGGKLIDKYIGFAYPAARELNLYFVSWMVNLEFAINAGLSHYVAGWSDPEVKAQLGARFTFTQHAVYARHPVLREALRRLKGSLERDWSRVPP